MIRSLTVEEIEKKCESDHNQWVTWSKNYAQSEDFSTAILKRWEKSWVPYNKLPEIEKERYRSAHRVFGN